MPIRSLADLALRMTQQVRNQQQGQEFSTGIVPGDYPQVDLNGNPMGTVSIGSGPTLTRSAVPQFFDPYTGEPRPATPQEVMAAMPAGSVNWADAIQAIDQSQLGINALQNPEVMQWLQQTQGFNPGVAGQVIAARQGGYDFSDPYIQSIMSWGRAPTQEELSQGYQSVAQQLAGRGDTSLEQAVQAGFFNQFPDVDQNWLGNFIAGTQSSRDTSVTDQALRTAAPITALPALFTGGTTAAAGVTGNINSTQDALNYGAVDAASIPVGFGLAQALPAVGLSTTAGGSTAAANALYDPGFGEDVPVPLEEPFPMTADPDVPGVPGTPGVPVPTPGVATPAAGVAAGTALSRILDGTATEADWASVLGIGAATGLGVYGATQQADAMRDVARMEDARIREMMGFGAPYRTRLADLTANPSAFLTSPEVTVPVDQATSSLARALSVQGNPTGNPAALSEIENYASNMLFGRLGEQMDRLAGYGGLTQYAGGAARGPDLRPAMGAINAEGNIYQTIGSGIADLTTPRRRSTLADLLV